MKEETPYYKFHFNKIFILESLSSDEQTGIHLHNDAVRPYTWQSTVLKSEYISITSSQDLFQSLDKIKLQITESQQLPYIHFEIHGSTSGLHLIQGNITWQELIIYLRQINILTRNNLMISFDTCFGNEVHKFIDFSDRAPFFGFVAPIATVSRKTIELGFNIFFNKLFSNEGFINAYKALNDSCFGDEYFILDNYENSFTRPLKNQIANLQDPSYYIKYIIERANEMLMYLGIRQAYSLPEMIELAKITTNEAIASLIQDLDFFLMRDLPPHNMVTQ